MLGEDKSNILASQIYRILSERFGTRSLARSRKRSQGQLRLHNRALKIVTFLKNAARQDLRKAQREESKESICSCTGQFLSLLREHSKAKRLADGQLVKLEARAARDDCHKHFCRFAKDLLDNNRATSISPTFSSQEAYNLFSKQYTTEPHGYSTPPWMPPSADPKYAMSSVDSITMEELLGAMKRSWSTSTPSPLDQVPYQVFKKCPSLVPALPDLFNTIITERAIPSNWKAAVFRLIGKSAAVEDLHSPSNFRAIALTPAISKLFSGT